MSTTTAIADSALPAISAKAWWLMNLTSAARGLTAGLTSPLNAGARPWSRPTVGAPLSVELAMIPPSR